MTTTSRRRFLAITATALGWAALPARAATPVTRWRGIALGAGATIVLAHPEAERLIAAARAEIARLEAVFSLYRADSALSRLNAAGALEAPPLELVDCLSLCGHLNAATKAAFDPSVQPLWDAFAASYAANGRPPGEAVLAAARAAVGWSGVHVAPDRIAFARPGMKLTLNGIAQGYIADRVAAMLADEGLTDILVDTGEMRAVGGHPEGGDWPVEFAAGGGGIGLRDMALASSSPLGTVLDPAGKVGHIFDPATGEPARPRWRQVSVTAPTAVLADGLSTAFCLMEREAMAAALAAFPAARLVHLA